MQIELAKPDEVDMLFIGNLYFTFENPGPYSVELENLSPAERNAIIYNVRKGVLKVDDLEALKKATMGQAGASTKFTTAAEVPIPNAQPIDFNSYLNKQLTDLRNFLRGGITTVKKEAVRLAPKELSRLLDLEKKGKKRKTLVSFLQELLDKHEAAVTTKVGSEDLVSQLSNIGNLDNVTEVIESEVIEVNLSKEQIDQEKE